MEHQQTFNEVHSLPSDELFSGLEISALAQCFQNPDSSSNPFYETLANSRHTFEPAASCDSDGAIPDSSCIRNTMVQWPTSAMNQFPHYELSRPDELRASYWNEMYEGHGRTFTVPPAPRIGAKTRPRASPYFIPLSPRVPIVSPEDTSEALLQLTGQSPSQQCYNQWKKILVDAVIVTGTDKFVPQTLYKPSTETDKERYLEKVALSPPIIFKTPGEWGISLEDALDGKTQYLVDKDVHVLQDCGPSVSIRINWPGYSSFKRQIPSRNWRKTKGPITKAKLAQSLAKTTAQFIEKMSNKPLELGAEESWKVGDQHVKVEDLILVSLHHVSKGSWQPQFRLRRDLT